MNKSVTTLSIVGLLGASNVNFASEEVIDVFHLDGNYGNGQIPVELNFTAPASGGKDGSINIKFGGFGIAEEDKQQN